MDEFKYLQKESYTPEDLKQLFNQHFTFVKKQVKEKLETKWSSKDVEMSEKLATLKETIKEQESKMKELETTNGDLESKVQTLEVEVSPLRDKDLVSTHEELLKELKVVDGAFKDVLRDAKITKETSIEDAKLAINKLIEDKPYLTITKSDDQTIIKSGEVKVESNEDNTNFEDGARVIGGLVF